MLLQEKGIMQMTLILYWELILKFYCSKNIEIYTIYGWWSVMSYSNKKMHGTAYALFNTWNLHYGWWSVPIMRMPLIN
jgi:hypothetical protein